jgi:ubiquinone/menaquinone biosynthesis C-methylase UbiE
MYILSYERRVLIMHSDGDLPKHFIEAQSINLTPLKAEGFILDIGGGGEGIIGQLMGERVIAIDLYKEELDEAPKGPLKVVMDARELNFLDETFNIVTAFFALMYIHNRDHKRVFEEVYRVLKPGGQFLVWDVVIPEQPENGKDIFVVPVEIELKNKLIKTAYGTSWKGKEQNYEYFEQIAAETGFEILDKDEYDDVYFIRLGKK